MNLNDLYQDLIIEHGTQPRNFYEMAPCTCMANGFNPLCGDSLKVFVLLAENKLSKISFIGQGCAISTASASIMSQELQNLTLEQAKAIIIAFKSLLVQQVEDTATLTGKLKALASVRQYPTRIKCAMLAWYALQEALDQQATE